MGDIDNSAPFRVAADLGLCQGHQMCQAEAPDVFEFDEDADQVVVRQERPEPQQRPAVEAAVRYCPAMALSIAPTHPGPMAESDQED